jgi:uncharacterized protein YhaN
VKLLKLDLRAFGPFTDVSLDLSAGSEGLHVIYGPNEAGKSSALRALEQMLFGIPARSADDFLHSYQNLRIGATLQMGGKPPIGFLRRKGAKNTLLGPDNTTPLDEGLLKPFLGGMDRELFATMFGIGHEQLVEGGKQLVSGSGNVGQVLFAAGSGIADLQQVVASLEKQANELYVRKGQTRRINESLKALDESRKKLRQSQLPSDEWVAHDRALRDARKRRGEIEEQLSARQAERNRLARIGRAIPAIARRKEFLRQLEELGEVVLLPGDFAEKRRDAMTRLAVARKAEQTAREELERIDGELRGIAIPQPLVDHAEAIEELPDQLGSYRKAQRDLPGLAARREQVVRDAAAILRQVRPDLSLDEAERLRMTRVQQVTLQKLGSRREGLVARLEQAREEIARGEQDLVRAEQSLERLPPDCDTASLKEAVRRVQNQGDLAGQLADAEGRLDTLRRKAAADLKKLRLWTATLEELEKAPVPARETVDRFATQLNQSEQQLVRARTALEDAERRRDDAAREFEKLELEGSVPSEEDLAEARRVREAAWQRVVEAWQTPRTQAAFSDEERGLAESHVQAVARADELADRLRREASRVAQRASLLAERRAAERQVEKLAQEVSRVEEARRRVEQAWADAWNPAGISPLSPQEMHAWLNQHGNLLQQSEAIRVQEIAAGQLRQRIESHRCELLQSLAAVEASSLPNAAETIPLGTLVERCLGVLDRADAAAERRAQLCRDADKLRAAIAAARSKADRAEAEQAAWQEQWALAVEPLGLAPDTIPEAVVQTLEEFNALFKKIEQSQELANRIEDIGHDAAAFDRSVRTLTEKTGGDLAGRTAEQAAEDLVQRLRKATADQQKQQELQDARRRYRAEHEKAARAVEDLAARLDTMRREAGCADVEAIPEVERASETALRLRERLQASEDQLVADSAGATLDEFIAEAEAEQADEIPIVLNQLGEEVRQLESELRDLGETIGGEAKLLAAMDTGADAADAAEETQDLLARLETDALQYLRLQLAKEILRESIERYRKKNEGPVLRRAGELFAKLTRGSFVGLAADFNDQNQSVLKGLRPEKGKSVELSGMSEGTADQLYLALRLASLESYLDGKEPMPFVVDDVLISFDDGRATTALEILAEFSRRAQVIFFTHHEHLVRLAEQHLDARDLFVHRLA